MEWLIPALVIGAVVALIVLAISRPGARTRRGTDSGAGWSGGGSDHDEPGGGHDGGGDGGGGGD